MKKTRRGYYTVLSKLSITYLNVFLLFIKVVKSTIFMGLNKIRITNLINELFLCESIQYKLNPKLTC